jgi:energy-coupling factor transport system substrate-specific component
VSWQLVSFLIIGAVLLAGFAWYERSRPPSQVVALVAALAALAIAGRIAFAAFPNVKPTTDIVIFAGYALGGAPGFAVGALAALVSNFWFGQGPWTPWQMAGWGLCGILGAALALGGRNVGRLTLAASCGAAGILYGALLNFSLMATYGGDLSWERFIVLEGRAVPFDAAHAVGNIVFALIAGPAMVRMLIRFRERFEWGRRGEAPARLTPGLRGGGVAALLFVLVAVGALAMPAPAQADEVSRATTWLLAQQNADGGFGASPGDHSGAEITCWAMLGLEAAGRNPLDVSRVGKTPVDFLRDSLTELKSPGDLARTIVALDGAGLDPRRFGGRNLVSKLLGKRRKDGSYEDWPNSTAFAVIALRAADATAGLDKTLDWLREVQNDDGGWGDTPGSPSTADGTGAVLQALTRGSKASHRGLVYLGKTQRKGGGFALGGNGEVNSQSTAWAIQGILAAGEDPDSFRKGGASAPEYLAARQDPDGHFRYSKSRNQTPVWVTGEALVAAASKYFPITAPPRVSSPKPSQASSPSSFGGITPSDVPVPGTESASVSPSESVGGAGGTPPGHSAKSGQSISGAQPAAPPSGEASGRGGTGPASDSAGSGSSSSTTVTNPEPSDSGSPAVAILLGLLAGALLFGVAWAGRRGWMRWRYGL